MPRVMLADDDHDTVYSFQVVLELNGYDVDGFTDPYLALRSGFDLFSLLKRKDHNANIYFVIAGEIKSYDRDDLPYKVNSNRFLRKQVSNADLVNYAASMVKCLKD